MEKGTLELVPLSQTDLVLTVILQGSLPHYTTEEEPEGALA